MSTPYDSSYTPPAPVLNVRLAVAGEPSQVGPLPAIVDTGSDGTLIPIRHLESIEAIGLGDAILHGVLGETREVHLYEVDIQVDSTLLPGMIVVGDDHGDEIILGRNVLNRLILSTSRNP
ncbi:MAG TPA: hypothetical protein VJG32_17315 [Anaerolineae bacterium]|nr:hypothetical protein [Anaerolineae bacterium]